MSIGSPAHSPHQRTPVDRVSQDMWEHQDTPLISVYVSQCILDCWYVSTMWSFTCAIPSILAACVRTPELFCAGLNREPCSLQADTCGPCYTRHVTASGEGENTFSNEPCFGEYEMGYTCTCCNVFHTRTYMYGCLRYHVLFVWQIHV